MSSCVEFEAKAVDKAVLKASEELNIPKEKLKYNVISHGSSGIFGLVGARKAKISVFLPKEKEKKKAEPRPSEQSSPKRSADEPVVPSAASLVNDAFGITEAETPDDSDSIDLTSHEAVIKGREVLKKIIDFITTGADISVENGSGRVLFNIQGGNTGVLIGKRGQTLEAIQYLVEKIINKQSEERIRIQIDVEGYLENRRNNLESLARRLADKAKQTGKPTTLGQMNAHDRRIIHLTLKDDTEVRTQSMGDGFYRKLVIFPRRKNAKRKK